MKKFLRAGLTAIALVFVLSSFAATETNAQINQILKQMESRYKKLKTLRTSVLYEIYNSVLQDTEKREGKMIYLPLKGRNALLRVDWKKPEESLTVVDSQYILYSPRLGQAIIGSTEKAKKNPSIMSSPLAFINTFINMSKAQLKANYKLKYLGAEKLSNGTKTWCLEITPKIAQPYKKAELRIDGNGMPVQMKITTKNDDTESILLSILKKNVRVKRAEFKINLPKGTKVIKN